MKRSNWDGFDTVTYWVMWLLLALMFTALTPLTLGRAITQGVPIRDWFEMFAFIWAETCDDLESFIQDIHDELEQGAPE